MAAATKVLFLEVDAGDKHVIRRGAIEGWMPTFKALLDRGFVGDTLAPAEFFVGGIWPTLYTGVDPAKHGMHSLVQLRTGTYEFVRCYPEKTLKRKPFWSALSAAGRRVAILDFPLSAITEDINGIQSVEWGSHDACYGFRAWPREFEEDVLTRFGRHPMSTSCNDHGNRPEDFRELREKLVAGVNAKSALTRHYLSQGGWDFFAQVFTESHCIGHQCWHLHDAKSPAHDSNTSALIGNPLKDVYMAIDSALGEVIAAAGEEATVFVLAGHRMAHKCGAQFLLPAILTRLGVAKERQVPLKLKLVQHVDAGLTWGWKHLPQKMRGRLNDIRRKLRGAIDSTIPGPSLPPHLRKLDLQNSKCFLMDNGFPITGLRVNLAGREPAGLICRGLEMDRFCDELTRDLLDLRYADTNNRAVNAVHRITAKYEGDYLDDLPDLVVEWSDETALGSSTCGNPAGSLVRIGSRKIGIVEGVNAYIRTGDHRPEGMFVAAGPNIRPGGLGHTVSIMDIAPTLCAMLGVGLPGASGVPIRELASAARELG